MALLDEFSKDENKSIFTVLLGEDITKEEEDKLSDMLPSRYPNVDFLIRRGEQNVYRFLVGAE